MDNVKITNGVREVATAKKARVRGGSAGWRRLSRGHTIELRRSRTYVVDRRSTSHRRRVQSMMIDVILRGRSTTPTEPPSSASASLRPTSTSKHRRRRGMTKASCATIVADRRPSEPQTIHRGPVTTKTCPTEWRVAATGSRRLAIIRTCHSEPRKAHRLPATTKT